MTPVLAHDDVLRFRGTVAARMGLWFDDAKLGALGEALARRLDARRCSAAVYLASVESHCEPDEVAALAHELAVGETYFFRNVDQFHALREVVLRERLELRAGRAPVRVLSAGCATGEEPYSIAMLVRDAGIEPATRVAIRGVDVDRGALERARRGRFTEWALRETPPATRQRWFKEIDRVLVLDESVRRSVQFDERNLAADDAELWQPESYDVVFFRNALMYFTPEAAAAAVERVSRALVPGGYLFLGHAETLRGLSRDFHLCHTHGTFYYQSRRELGQVRGERSPARASSTWVEPVAAVAEASSWVEAIQRAAERVRSLTEAPRVTLAGVAASAAPNATLGCALGLLRSERYGDALALVDALAPELARDPEVLLLRAVLLTHSGALAPAEKACFELLAVDELSASAHYLLALCREGVTDRAGALEHDRVAVYLDPSFAMPRLHLGLLARRRGDGDGARFELGQALILLQREDPSRMLLFGGGFSRDALVALCRSELLASGGRP